MKKTLSLILVILMMVLSITVFVPPVEAEAATIEDSNVFLKQQTNYTCTLVAATMMVRRTAILAGLDNWDSITETSMRRVAWLENQGLYYNFSYTLNGTKITVKGYENGLSGSYATKKAKLISLLKDHPEGVVIYNHYPAHAILLTKYVESTDTFYCADPAPHISKGQIPLSSSSLAGSGQTAKIEGLDTYWIVKSPSVSLPNQYSLTINYHANGGSISGSQVIGKAYKVTTDDGTTATVRSGAGLNYGQIGAFVSGTVVVVTETKQDSQYTWGKVDYYGTEGWMALGSWMVYQGDGYNQPYHTSSNYIYNTYTGEKVVTTWACGSTLKDGLYNNTTFHLYRDGYTFLGWSLSPSGGTIIDQDDTSVTPESIYPDVVNGSKTVTMYAIWEKDVCNHTYDNNCDKYCNKCGESRSTSHTYTNNCDDSCNVCGATRSTSHTYSNNCDAICNVCGYTRSTSHTYSNNCDSSCNVCGATRNVSHTYTNGCDDTCNSCGYTRSASHTYSNNCDNSCNTCGATRSTSHTYSNNCDSSCNVCGATRNVSHTYTNGCDDTCDSCGYTRSVSHKYSNSCDNSCNTCGAIRDFTHTYTNDCDDTCNVCSAKRNVKHDYDSDYMYSKYSHWRNCDCGESEATSYHMYSSDCDKNCNVCGYEREEITHTDDDKDRRCDYCDEIIKKDSSKDEDDNDRDDEGIFENETAKTAVIVGASVLGTSGVAAVIGAARRRSAVRKAVSGSANAKPEETPKKKESENKPENKE